MSATDLARTLAQMMRDLPAALRPWSGITKVDLIAAVSAADGWISDNAASFNNALPATPKANLTPAQKAFLLAYVTLRRAGALHAEEDG